MTAAEGMAKGVARRKLVHVSAVVVVPRATDCACAEESLIDVAGRRP